MNQESWNELVVHQQGSFLQSWQWGEFQQAVGKPVERFVVDNAIAQVIVYPLVKGKTYLFTPNGPLGSNAQVLVPKIQEIVNQYKAIFWRHESDPHIYGGKAIKPIHPQHTWLLDLAESDVLLKNMKPKWRYNIRLAEKKGVTIRVSDNVKDVTAIYDLLANTAQRQGIRIHGLEYYQTMVEVLRESKMIKLYLAEYDNRIIAGNIMIGFGKMMTYVHGGTNHDYRAVMAPHLLQWQAIVDAYQAGYAQYDFFGVAPPDSKNHSWEGITRFKQGFGGYAHTLYGTYEVPLKCIWYTGYTLAKRLWI